MAKVPFLPPTDFQLQILKHYVEELGMGVGVSKLYERLKRDLGDTTHPALDKARKIKYTDDGKAWELSNTPTNLKGDEYVSNKANWKVALANIKKRAAKIMKA